MVAKDDTQRESIDYNEVVSPIVKHSSIRILFALVAQNELELDQLNIRTAFLYGNLEEEIYMSQPTGFKTARKEHMVCKLKKSLYRLKQSSRQWYKHFYSFMRSRCTHEAIMTYVCITISYRVDSTSIYCCM